MKCCSFKMISLPQCCHPMAKLMYDSADQDSDEKIGQLTDRKVNARHLIIQQKTWPEWSGWAQMVHTGIAAQINAPSWHFNSYRPLRHSPPLARPVRGTLPVNLPSSDSKSATAFCSGEPQTQTLPGPQTPYQHWTWNRGAIRTHTYIYIGWNKILNSGFLINDDERSRKGDWLWICVCVCVWGGGDTHNALL